MKKKRAASAARFACALAGAIVIIAGCHKVTGGGWITGVNGGKATFGFQAQCVWTDPDPVNNPGNDGWWQFEGQFQYNDRLAGVRFHGDIEPFISIFDPANPNPDTCEENVANGGALNEALIRGTCTTSTGETGTFSVIVADNGTPGSLAGDIITVDTPAITGGSPCTADGQPYSNNGILQGGNIVSHGHKDAGSSTKKKG